ncbi:hypothetical protein [Paraburkholderia hospita]|uniref:hypothetical protein n=1 Tax=Paraburkholderia hospita TaxID=169430 RepID=UPI0012600E0D|nr:hypothetical protein [Paraburkholderia hospita]
MKHEGITRMPAQKPKHQTATHEARRQYADANAKAKAKAKQPNRLRSKHASKKQKNQTTHTAKVPREL